jgi:hypothetical protein
MNKSKLFTIGGALMASTALAGAANAATVGRIAAGPTYTTTALSVANTVFGVTTTQANAVTVSGATFAVNLANTFLPNTRFNATLNLSGAQFVTSGIKVSLLARSASGSTFAGTVTGACANVTPLVDKILISNCEMSTGTASFNTATVGGIQLSGVVFNTAAGLATAGTSISLSGTVNDAANPSTVLENITSGNLITSAAPITTTITAGTSAVANPNTTPTAFTNFSAGGGDGLTVTLATVNITSSGAVGTDLASAVTVNLGSAGDRAASSVNITLTSAAFSDDALSSVVSTGPLAFTFTPAAFSGGSVALNSNAANLSTGATTVNAIFNGTSAIDTAAAGTVTVAYGSGASNGVIAAAGATGSTAAITLGGFSAEFNTAYASNSAFQSFIRIHNNGNAAGAVTITVLNDATGATLGTHTTSSIAVGQTLQVSMPDIEAGAGITTPSGFYTLKVTGPIVGYAQHVLWNPNNESFTDLSGFRNAGSNTNVP